MAVAARSVEAVLERLREQLSRRDRSWIRFRTLVRVAGQENQSAHLVEKLERAMREAEPRVFHFPKSLEKCQPDDTILVSFEEFRDPGLPFVNEAELVALIVNRYKSLAPFSNCISVQRQRQCDAGKIDLCFREWGGGYVVCELEKESGRFETASQIKAYMHSLHAELTEDGGEAKVRGVIITGRENPAEEAEIAEWSQLTKFKVDWYYYRLGFELEAAPLSPPTPELTAS